MVKCDAVVVGSGAGAGPCTALLAAAGLRVVVLEKGTFTPNHELTMTVLDSLLDTQIRYLVIMSALYFQQR